MRNYLFLVLTFLQLIISFACESQNSNKGDTMTIDKIEQFVLEHSDNHLISISNGTPSDGSLQNAKLMPFSGVNFTYFDTSSYLASRAFVDERVRTTTLNAYAKMEKLAPNRQFCLMECSHEQGGELFPHKTHQNGMSVDFMTPLLKDSLPYYELDHIGAEHYLLEFDDNGKYIKAPSITIDFELLAQHILVLNEEAKK